jgi:hypothetical protein
MNGKMAYKIKTKKRKIKCSNCKVIIKGKPTYFQTNKICNKCFERMKEEKKWK